ncbi:MAG: DNA-directed RNA polymerase subunit alpha [Candidatus Vogelbacteria bacterium RIFOXYD1_FULL_46_19]|uniref:DNA-directed RNA polymerase subunit alpha n=1 Tax=Candidatus Vogelbacteria bacterium RIFOXYD1_FULL_46_19 TaxID=1802439 RepID=A0A1G2QGJ7_9BACT|nr:MAG: DNA-directed RNA polymerase subunit alpha [Candidatus Vogelbacteria bacterium RIFOXYD1_FULL_46_19]
MILPSKPMVVREEDNTGVYEIEGLYPGYGHTLGNSLRRIILSSLPGYAITAVKIDGVNHEFSTISGVKEDVINIILNLKKIRFKVVSDEAKTVNLNITGVKDITAGDIDTGGDIEVVTPNQPIASITNKGTTLKMEITLEKGLGYVPKEVLQKDKVDVGVIALDAIFTPIRRVSYEVDQMRVGNRTDYNRLRITIETNGDITPREAIEQSIAIMINQLKAIVGFKEEAENFTSSATTDQEDRAQAEKEMAGVGTEEPEEEDILKTRVEDLNLSARTQKSLAGAGIRTVGGLIRKKENDLLSVDGLGEKGLQEIKRALSNFGIILK